MPRADLPANCRWTHAAYDGALMHYNGAACARVSQGRIWLAWRNSQIDAPHPGSIRQGMRFAERWIAVQSGLPGVHKGYHEDSRRNAERRPVLDAMLRRMRATDRPAQKPIAMCHTAADDDELWAMEDFPK